jgi:hypothetical protein
MWDKSIQILHVSALQDYLKREQLVLSEITETIEELCLNFL